jgi:hypothetical protein
MIFNYTLSSLTGSGRSTLAADPKGLYPYICPMQASGSWLKTAVLPGEGKLLDKRKMEEVRQEWHSTSPKQTWVSPSALSPNSSIFPEHLWSDAVPNSKNKTLHTKTPSHEVPSHSPGWQTWM